MRSSAARSNYSLYRFEYKTAACSAASVCAAPSVRDLVGLFFPRAKTFDGLIRHHLYHRNFSLIQRKRDFVVNKRIVKTHLRRVRGRIAVVNALRPRPINCPEAHRARLAGSGDFTGRHFERAELAGRERE